jgi:hypothetical protein
MILRGCNGELFKSYSQPQKPRFYFDFRRLCDPVSTLQRSRERQIRSHSRRLIMKVDDELDFRMHRGASNLANEFARGPIGRCCLVFCFPGVKLLFFTRVPWPARRFAPIRVASPGLGRQARAETFLAFAQFSIERVRSQRLKYLIRRRRIGFYCTLRCQQAQTRARPINAPTPLIIFARPRFDPFQRVIFFRRIRRGLRAPFAKQRLKKPDSGSGWFREINIHKHHAQGKIMITLQALRSGPQ